MAAPTSHVSQFRNPQDPQRREPAQANHQQHYLCYLQQCETCSHHLNPFGGEHPRTMSKTPWILSQTKPRYSMMWLLCSPASQPWRQWKQYDEHRWVKYLGFTTIQLEVKEPFGWQVKRRQESQQSPVAPNSTPLGIVLFGCVHCFCSGCSHMTSVLKIWP